MAGAPRAHGGKRVGAGRASPERSLRAAKKRALADGGKLPLDVQVYAMRFHFARHEAELRKKPANRDEKALVAELKEARAAADSAAPYLHPRLQAVEHSGNFRVTFEDALKELQRESA